MLASEEKLTEFVRRLREAAGDNLQSVLLYGSAARGDYQADQSDLNLLCVLGSVKAGDLSRIAPVVRWWSGPLREPPPQFFTREELRDSADVFAIELVDITESHKVLFGSDPVAGIEVPMNLHRVEVEHDLRTLLQRLRAHFLRFSENEAELRAVYAKSVSGLTVLLRHVLIAFGEDPPAAKSAVYRRIEELTGAAAQAFEVGGAFRSDHPGAEVARAFGKYLEAVEAVVQALDAIVPKRQWQRVKHHDF
jgi:hypothetical protein